MNRLSACPECLSVNGHETLCPYNDDEDNTEYDYGNEIDYAYAQWRDSEDNRP